MLSRYTARRAFSQWLHTRLATQKSKTVALLVHDDEVKSKQLDCLSHLHDSQEFVDDLALRKSLWVYTKDARRCLLLHYKPDKDNKHEQALRSLGATAVSQLQAMKVSDVEVIASSKIDAEHLGVFYNSMHLSNYEFTLKTDLKDESEPQEEEKDARCKRSKKTLDSITVSHEK